MKRKPASRPRAAAAVLALALTLSLTGCGAANSAGAAADTTQSYSAESFTISEGTDAGAPLLDPGAVETGETARKIVYTADLDLESTRYDETREALLAAVEAQGGYLAASSQGGSAADQNRWASFTARIPAENYRAFLDAAGEAGNLRNLSEQAEDITSRYIDVEARLSALEAQRDRLNALADEAETTADLLEIEQQLGDVQYQIESYTQQRRQMDGAVQYSTVEISLEEVTTLTPETPAGFAGQIAQAFTGGWQAFRSVLTGLVLTMVYLWPLWIALAIVLVVLRVTRPARAARKARKEAARQKSRAARAGYAPGRPGPSAAESAAAKQTPAGTDKPESLTPAPDDAAGADGAPTPKYTKR